MSIAVLSVGIVMAAAGARTRATLLRACVRSRSRRSMDRRTRVTRAHTAAQLVRRCLVNRTRTRLQPDDSQAQALAGLLDDIARRCASGESLACAFAVSRNVCAMSPMFEHTARALQRGATLAEALEHQLADNASSAMVVHVLTLCARVGGNVSESLDRAASTLRERHAAAQERVVQSAQARLSAQVLTALPLGFALWTVVTSHQVRQFVLTPVGLACLLLGLSLNLAGWRIMSRIVGGMQ